MDDAPARPVAVELADRLLASLQRGDVVAASALFADEIDFDIPHAEPVWWVPAVRTREDLRGFLDQLGGELETLAFDVEVLVGDDRDAVVMGTIYDRVRRHGRDFRSRFAMRLTAEDGQLVRYHFLEDSAAAAHAARG